MVLLVTAAALPGAVLGWPSWHHPDGDAEGDADLLVDEAAARMRAHALAAGAAGYAEHRRAGASGGSRRRLAS